MSPGTSIGCKHLPSVSVDSQCFGDTLAGVIEEQMGSPSWPPSCRQFSIEKVLGDKAVLLAWPSQRRCLCLSTVYMMVVPALSSTVSLGTGGVHGGGTSPLKHCVIGYWRVYMEVVSNLSSTVSLGTGGGTWRWSLTSQAL